MMLLDALLFVLCICILTLCEAGIPQADFCQSQNVVKAQLLREGHIEKINGVKPSEDLPKYYQRFELKILDIFRTNRKEAKGRSNLYYAMSRDTTFNQDADGCDFHDVDDFALFYFDDWENIVLKRTCKGWLYSTSGYEKNALQKQLYDCECDLKKCWDRLNKRMGEPRCESQMDQILCRLEKNKGCIWKGSRQTCVNPYSLTSKIRKRKHVR